MSEDDPADEAPDKSASTALTDTQMTTEDLHAEIARLRARVAALEQGPVGARGGSAEPPGAAGLPTDEPALRHSGYLLETIIDNSSAVIFVKDVEGRHLLINRRYETLFKVTRAGYLGKTDYELFPAEVADQLRAHDKKVMAGGVPVEVEEVVPHDDGPHTYITVKFPLFRADNAVIGVCGIATDMTEWRRVEKAHAALQQQIIDAQTASLRELSAPLMPLSEGVLAMPLIGAIDSARAGQIMETLLDGITARRARIAILDVTGIKTIDSYAAEALVRIAGAARLLGAEVILTGISGPVAMSLVGLGVDLGGVRTLDTLQSGIAYALRH